MRDEGCNHQTALEVAATLRLAEGYSHTAVGCKDCGVEEPAVTPDFNVEIATCLCCLGPCQAEFLELENGQHIGVVSRCRLCSPVRAEERVE